MMRNQQTKFSANKRVGLTLIAIGVVLLVAAFISVPFQWGKGIRQILLIGGFASFLVAAPLMWKKGLANIRSGKAMPGSLLRIRQSGSFDFLVLFLAIGLLLLVLGGVGKVSYQATLDKHIELAGMEGKIATLEEARRNSAFI
jgi:hypothetical protein